jgi:hypothetical protein
MLGLVVALASEPRRHMRPGPDSSWLSRKQRVIRSALTTSLLFWVIYWGLKVSYYAYPQHADPARGLVVPLEVKGPGRVVYVPEWAAFLITSSYWLAVASLAVVAIVLIIHRGNRWDLFK